MMRSLFSGVSGLKVHQIRMDNIGNNIANVNTVGFKSTRTTFSDMLSQTQAGAASPTDNLGGTNPKQIGLGVQVASMDLIFTDGSPQSTGKNSDLSLSGNGLFVVKGGSSTYYTRDGAFEYDANGYYVLPGSGYKVQGWNAVNGSLNTNSLPEDIIVPAGKTMEASATTQVKFSGNLNAGALEIIEINGTDVVGTAIEVEKGTTVKLRDGTTVAAADAGTYTIGHSIPVPSTVSIYDSLGNTHEVPILMEMCPEEMIQEDLQNGIAKKSCWKVSLAYDSTQQVPDDTGTTTSAATSTRIQLDDGTIVEMSDDVYVYFNTDGTFSHLIQEKSDAANTFTDLTSRGNPNALAASNTGLSTADPDFGNHARDGAANAAAAQVSQNTPNTASVNDDTDTGTAQLVLKYTQAYDSDTTTNTAIDQKLDAYNYSTGLYEDTRVQLVFNDSTAPLTQYYGSSTAYPSGDGNEFGTLISVSADTSGIITGTYTNGQRRYEAQVAVAQFVNPAGLTKTGNSLYSESNNSGTANVKTAPDLGLTITPAALEMSNVDLANEFSEMIITQRGFQANSKIINVGDEMLETLVNMKR